MTDDQIKQLILLIIGEADYDLAKSFDSETAEEPKYAERNLKRIVKAVKKYLKDTNQLD